MLITLDPSFQMDSIHEKKQGLRGERSQTCHHKLSAKQESIWHHYYNVFGMMQLGVEPPTQEVNTLPQSHHCSMRQYRGGRM